MMGVFGFYQFSPWASTDRHYFSRLPSSIRVIHNVNGQRVVTRKQMLGNQFTLFFNQFFWIYRQYDNWHWCVKPSTEQVRLINLESYIHTFS